MPRVLSMPLLAAVVFALAASCGGEDGGGQEGGSTEEPLRVVATYSILGDLVENVGGEEVEVTTLVGPDGDAHTFEPKPSDGAELSGADVVFENGLGFETWLDDLYESSGSRAQRAVVTESIEPLGFSGEGHEHGHGADEGHGHGHEHGTGEEASARLLVADGEDARAKLVDLGSGEELGDYELEQPPFVYASNDGRYGFVVQRDDGGPDAVSVLDGGSWAEDHGDHQHHYGEDPRMLGFEFDGEDPSHVVSHDGRVAVFNDGDGTVSVVAEEELEEDRPRVTTIETGEPHHGVAVPVGDKVVASTPVGGEELPDGVAMHDGETGEKLREFRGCPELHGEAVAGETLAFACEDGVMLLEPEGDGFSSRKIGYPDDAPAGARSWSLFGDEDLPYLVGDFGEDGLLRVDLESGEASASSLPDELSYNGLALSPGDGGRALAVTTDGRLHRVGLEGGEVDGSVPVVEPFGLGEDDGPWPSVVVSGDAAYVSSPAEGEVVEVDVGDMEFEDAFGVGGKPQGLAVLGPEADEHSHGDEHAEENQEEGHEHGHEDGHHHHGEFDPHVWQDPNNAVAMVEEIRDALVEADPENAETYERNAEAYLGELEELDAEVTEQVETIPEENRVLFTTHDTFGYFAERYGFEVDTALASVSTEASDPSAGEIAALVEEIRASGVPAVFAENIANPDLMRRIADEAGVELAPPLYTDALGEEGTEGDTYVKMVRYNASTISEALGG